jgi:arylsulfatase A-like enzyme/Tfp pilus assembly protein PilF
MNLMRPSALAIALLGTGALSCADSPDSRGILLITIDTCRADRLGCYGAKNVETPALDDLAKRGSVFLQATAPAPLTLPSHCTMLTGLYPDRHSVRDNGEARLPEEARTLAEVLRENGWATAAFVSAFPLSSEFGCDQGFETYDDALRSNASGKSPAQDSEDDALRLFYDERVAKDVTDASLEWLRPALEKKQPFLLWVHYFDPHASYRPPEPFASRYGMQSYEGEVAFVDAEIRRILDAVRPARDDLTIAVVADHGESLGEHEEMTHGVFVYESTLRVPWILAGPRVPRGVRFEKPVSIAHLMPTILDACAIEPPSGIDGVSLLPVLEGHADPPPAAFAESRFPTLHFGWASLRSVRRENWKLILAPRPELFDLAADPHEQRDVAAEHPEVVAELREDLRRHESRAAALAVAPMHEDEETRSKLSALGYVGGGASAPTDSADAWNMKGRDPKDMVGIFNRLQEVSTLLVDGRDTEAERVLREILEDDANNLEAMGEFALLRKSQGNWKDAKKWCEEILRRRPESSTARMNLASALLKLDDRRGALAQYDETVSRDPGHADAWALRGSLLSEQRRHEEAIESIARAVALEPRDAKLVAALGRAREDSGDSTKALSEYDRALALDAKERSAIVQKGLLLSHLGRVEDAAATFRAGLEQLPEDAEILNNLAWLLVDRSIDPAQAYELAARAVRQSPEDSAFLDTLGWAAVRSGRPREAIEPLRKALAATNDPTVRAHLGIALAESGQTREGIELVRRAVRDQPDLDEIPEVRAWINRPL